MKLRYFATIIVLLFLFSCTKKYDYPSISGFVTLCNNNNCGAILSDSLEIEIVKYPAGETFGTLFWALYEYKPGDSIKNILISFIVEKIEKAYPNKFKYIESWNIKAQFNFRLDTSQLCGDCQDIYDKFGLAINTPPDMVNIKISGFSSEISIKNAIAKNSDLLVMRNAMRIYPIMEKAQLRLVEVDFYAIAYNGMNFKEAMKKAKEDYAWNLNFHNEQDTESRKTYDWLSKDPDKMSDEEWYDHMENLSDDPVWKETVREQRKAKGL